MQLIPSQLVTLLTGTIAARLPVLVIGGPGVGKTSLIAVAAEQAGNKLIVSHPAVADPTDPKGFPWMQKGDKVAKFVPFGETAEVLYSTEPTTWFWDDFGQAGAAVQAAYMPWLLARRVNGHALPDHVTIIAATNRRADRANVGGLLEPVKSRFATIVEVVSELDEWCQWALGAAGVPPEIVAYLRFVGGDHLNHFEATAELTNSPVPRTWENAGNILKLKLPVAVEAAALAGAVGAAEATQFGAFLSMYRNLPNIDGILMDPDKAVVSDEPSVLYAVATSVAARATEKNFNRVVRYAERLNEAEHGDFAALMLRDAFRRKPELQQTPEFVRLASSDLGKLMGGY